MASVTCALADFSKVLEREISAGARGAVLERDGTTLRLVVTSSGGDLQVTERAMIKVISEKKIRGLSVLSELKAVKEQLAAAQEMIRTQREMIMDQGDNIRQLTEDFRRLSIEEDHPLDFFIQA